MTLALAAGLAGVPAAAQEGAEAPFNRFDPALSNAAPQAPAAPAAAPVVVEQGDGQTNLRLPTETPLAPYLGAERGLDLSPQERRLLPAAKDGGKFTDYRLEAGVGVLVEDKASLNLGYRFHEPPSLLNERSTDPLALSGDLRISFDLKVPF